MSSPDAIAKSVQQMAKMATAPQASKKVGAENPQAALARRQIGPGMYER
jgi:hypothetical protein